MASDIRIQHTYPEALEFLRAQGPDAVLVLHDLLLRAELRRGALVVEVSVRQLAEDLGFLSKDSAHRRLRQLLRAGVLRIDPSSVGGFTTPVPVIDLTGTGISPVTRSPRPAA